MDTHSANFSLASDTFYWRMLSCQSPSEENEIWIICKAICFFETITKDAENLKLLWFQKQPLELFYRKAVLKHFTIFTGSHLRRSLFNKVTGLKVCNFVKNRLTVVWQNFLRTSISKKHLSTAASMIWNGFRTIATDKNCIPTPTLTPNLNLILNWGNTFPWRQFSGHHLQHGI